MMIYILMIDTCLLQCTAHLSEGCLSDLSSLVSHSRITTRTYYEVTNQDLWTARGHEALKQGLAAAAAEASGGTPNLEQNFTTAESQPAMPSPSVAVISLVEYDSSDEEEDCQDSQNTSLPSPLNTSASRRTSGQFSVFMPDDHNYLGMMEKYKSLFKNLLKRKRENKTLSFAFKAQLHLCSVTV